MVEITLESFCSETFCIQHTTINHLQSISYLSEEMKEQAKYAKKKCEFCLAKKFYDWYLFKIKKN